MRFLLVMTCVAFLTACKEEAEHTLKAVQSCIDENQTSLVDPITIRNRCAHELSATGKYMLGGTMQFDPSVVTIRVKNSTSDRIVTSVSVNIDSSVDQPGFREIAIPGTKYTPGRTVTIPENRFLVGDLWIEPGQWGIATIPRSDVAKVLPILTAGFASSTLDHQAYSWNYQSYRYIEIKVR
ncbi:hypothetical protein [Ruegeria sp. MALMAid1280]|uniref:hypothetical protein n=1 Tax=Ruegeria sp. MALMAid1280 TaxID=3411634 RepID=UPI003B9DC82F